MKKILSILAVTLLLTACGSGETETCTTTDSTCVKVDTNVVAVDTVVTDSVTTTTVTE